MPSYTRLLIMILLFAICAVPHAGAMEMNHEMDPEALQEWGAKDDAAFLTAMIVHHRGALAMSEPLTGSTDPSVRQWAAGIIVSQRSEIGIMEAILKEVGGTDKDAEEMMEHDMKTMLAETVSDDPAVNFVMLMVSHHAGAVDMALPALVMTENAKVREVAKSVIIQQADEIAAFRSWLMSKNINTKQ